MYSHLSKRLAVIFLSCFLGTVEEDGLQSIGCCEIIKFKQLHCTTQPACVCLTMRARDAASVVCV